MLCPPCGWNRAGPRDSSRSFMFIGLSASCQPPRTYCAWHIERLESRLLLAATHPSVSDTRPGDGQSDVARNAFIAADLNLVGPGEIVDAATLNSSTIALVRASNSAAVGGVINTPAGGDVIVFTPGHLLDADTQYTFTISSGVMDTAGHTFVPYASTFTTGNSGGESNSDIRFTQIALSNAKGLHYTALAVGPDHRLYVAGDS